MAKYFVILICAFSLVGAISSAGQPNPSVLVFGFSQNNNTYTWDNNYSKGFDFGRLKCDLNVNTNSLLLKKPTKRWQEQVSATFNADYTILDGVSLAPLISHSRVALQDRIVYTSELKLSVPVRKLKYIDITPFIANRAIKRLGDDPSGVDKGLGYGIAVNAKPFRLLGNNIESVMSYKYYDLSRIPFGEFDAGLSGSMAFKQADTLAWRLHDSESTTRYYARVRSSTRADDLIQIMRQVKVDRRAEYLARIVLPLDIAARLNGDLGFLSYYYSPGSVSGTLGQADNYTEGRNYNIVFEKIFRDRLKLSAGYRYGWGKEDYRGDVLDQWMELGELSFNASSEITPDDSAAFDGIIGVTSYYGLKTSSDNERDVKTQIYNLKYKHVFSQYFAGGFRAGFSNFHQIYTNSIFSANNNENKTYLIQTDFAWSIMPELTIDQIFAIQANYIIYDFVPSQSATPNRIFRRGSSETRFNIKMTDRFTLMPAYLYRYEDYGKLIYEDENWQMATGWDRRVHSLDIRIGYFPTAKFYIEPEYSWEFKREYNHIAAVDQANGVDIIERELRLRDSKQIAGVNVIWSFSQSESLRFSYSRREWDVKDRDKDISEFINVSVRYQF
jgi:hypothetical protein